MAVVKGSRQRAVKVIETRPAIRILMGLGSVVLIVGAVVGSYLGGYLQGVGQKAKTLEDVARLEANLAASQSRVGQLEQDVANMALGSEVDRKANEEVRQQVIQLKEEIATLSEENSFYRGLMAPSEDKQGLTIGAVEIQNTERPKVYKYKVVMQQFAKRHNLLSGHLEFNILGRELNTGKQYALYQVSNQYDSARIKLRFKYFQTIAGEITLPEGFEPDGLELVAHSNAANGKAATKITKRFEWLVQETL